DCLTVSREFELGSVIFCKVVAHTGGDCDKKKEGILLYSVTEFWTPPQLAFFFWHRTKSPDLFEAIKLMIAQTRNVSAAGPGGQTLLHLAALAGAKRAVELLIARGAKATIKDENGNTPLELAVAAGHEEVAEILRKAARGRNQ
ncbi:MAG: ankyrin repeat domain-containing protein, partial [Kiritimatiellaeota bacterium]|nr:ankyrin repeat domain-containing protein [Kiritimatiellota bacterium]